MSTNNIPTTLLKNRSHHYLVPSITNTHVIHSNIYQHYPLTTVNQPAVSHFTLSTSYLSAVLSHLHLPAVSPSINSTINQNHTFAIHSNIYQHVLNHQPTLTPSKTSNQHSLLHLLNHLPISSTLTPPSTSSLSFHQFNQHTLASHSNTYQHTFNPEPLTSTLPTTNQHYPPRNHRTNTLTSPTQPPTYQQ